MNNNSVVPYTNATLAELQQAAGIGQFTGADGWDILMSGFLFQGGLSAIIPVDGSLVVTFNKAYPQQVFGVFLQAIYPSANDTAVVNNSGFIKAGSVALDSFIIINDADAKQFYWWAIGL